MKAAMWHGYKDVRIEDVPVPKAAPGSVVIKVAWAGICGTDRHEYVGPNFIPTTKPHRLTGKTAPLIMGHEFSGIISEVGENVRGWAVGDRVTANGTLCCNECEMCRSGRYNVCKKLGFVGVGRDGTFAEYVEIEAARLFKIPNNVPLREAIVAEPLACGIHATRLMGSMEGKDVVIVGPGIIGLSCFLAAKFAGARRLLVGGVGDDRKALVERYGGVYVDVAKTDLFAAVEDWSGGNMADVVYECVGSQRTLDSCISVMKPGAKLMVMGVFEEKPVFPMNDFQEGERELYTSQAHVDEIAAALDLFQNGLVDPAELITREVTLHTLVEEGFEELIKHGPKHIKVAIQINEEK
ncbi:alcohol dehydrogenase catalytic domain-containing protein [Christensenellaceae bacterium OttesenSCG-928-L17]|nr:alcohol dehydrogenase catalytic domain-containing protein [Christensenellaceae bacterium OttesenSCG-928-L17]